MKILNTLTAFSKHSDQFPYLLLIMKEKEMSIDTVPTEYEKQCLANMHCMHTLYLGTVINA